jgi:hypothetical protein
MHIFDKLKDLFSGFLQHFRQDKQLLGLPLPEVLLQ